MTYVGRAAHAAEGVDGGDAGLCVQGGVADAGVEHLGVTVSHVAKGLEGHDDQVVLAARLLTSPHQVGPEGIGDGAYLGAAAAVGGAAVVVDQGGDGQSRLAVQWGRGDQGGQLGKHGGRGLLDEGQRVEPQGQLSAGHLSAQNQVLDEAGRGYVTNVGHGVMKVLPAVVNGFV